MLVPKDTPEVTKAEEDKKIKGTKKLEREESETLLLCK